MTTAADPRSTAIAEPYLALIRIEAGGSILALTDNTEAVSYAGVVYQPWPVRLTLGATGADRQVAAQIELSNVSQAAASALRVVSEPPVCDIRVVTVRRAEILTYQGEVVTWGDEPVTIGGGGLGWGVRTVEAELLGLRIVAVDFGAATAVCRLSAEYDYTRETFPPLRHDGRFKGLWA